jgi:hypothetical protein
LGPDTVGCIIDQSLRIGTTPFPCGFGFLIGVDIGTVTLSLLERRVI